MCVVSDPLYKIFTTPACYYCNKAIEIAEQTSIPYKVLPKIPENIELLRTMYIDFTGQPPDNPTLTYPRIFVGKKLIGGCDDFTQYAEDCLGGLCS